VNRFARRILHETINATVEETNWTIGLNHPPPQLVFTSRERCGCWRTRRNLPVPAKIIYTPAHERIVQQTAVDLNHDGINDFALNPGSGTNGGLSFRYLAAFASRQKNAVVRQGSSASALKAGMSIGPDQQFMPGRELMAAWSSNGNRYTGQWMNDGKGVKNRYLGIRFSIKGKVHYGWARLTVTPTKGFVGILTGYAYETIPNKPIIAGRTQGPDEIGASVRVSPTILSAPVPEPATLGLLAQGAAGLVAWRRRDAGQCA
jgi:hypothetical protein